MKLAIMQPYFFPYIGYFQLISTADMFVVYDNIKYTKKGWINRNRILKNCKDQIISLPLKKDSDYLCICERELSSGFNRDKLLSQIKGSYKRAPYFTEVFQLVECVIRYEDRNLFRYLYHSIVKLCEYLEITTDIKISSDIAIDHRLRSQEKVLALCEALGANSYINTIGGLELYSRETFLERDVALEFIRLKSFKYSQFEQEFVPWLSIIDVMMFNSVNAIQECLNSNYELIEGE